MAEILFIEIKTDGREGQSSVIVFNFLPLPSFYRLREEISRPHLAVFRVYARHFGLTP